MEFEVDAIVSDQHLTYSADPNLSTSVTLAVLPPAMPAESDLGDAAGAVHGLTLETVFECLPPPEVSVIEPPRVSWSGCNGLGTR